MKAVLVKENIPKVGKHPNWISIKILKIILWKCEIHSLKVFKTEKNKTKMSLIKVNFNSNKWGKLECIKMF